MNRGNTTLKKRKETYKVEGREPARQAGVGPRLPPSSETAFFALEMPMGKIFQRTWVLCLAPMSQLSLCRIIIKVCWEHRKQHLSLVPSPFSPTELATNGFLREHSLRSPVFNEKQGRGLCWAAQGMLESQPQTEKLSAGQLQNSRFCPHPQPPGPSAS